MVAFDNSYSKMVAGLKVILPMLALAILSTLFLVSRSQNNPESVSFSDINVDELAENQQVGGPIYSGVTADGASFTITAKSAKPDLTGKQEMTASSIVANIETKDGTTIKLTAPEGLIFPNRKKTRLSNGVKISTSTGFNIATDIIFTRLNMSKISTEGRISATGPFGSFTAGKMVMTQQSDSGSEANYLMVFTDGVKLVYNPKKE